MEFVEISEQEYFDFQKKHEYQNFMNSVWAMKLKLKKGWDVSYYGIKDNNHLLVATTLASIPVMKRHRYVVAQRGFLVDYRNKEIFAFFMEKLKVHLHKMNCLYFHIDPYICYQERDKEAQVIEGGFNNKDIVENLKQMGFEHLGFSVGHGNIYPSRWMFALSLVGKNRETLLANMHQQTRWSINKTLREGICVRELTIEELPLFSAIMEHTSQRRKFENYDETYYKTFLEAYGEHAKLLLAYLDVDKHIEKIEVEKSEALEDLNKTETKLLETPNNKKMKKRKNVLIEAIELYDKKIDKALKMKQEKGNEIPLAASIFVMLGEEVTYLFSGSYDEYKKYNAPYALQWHMLQYALDYGYKKYNFYGTSGDFRKEAEDYGVYEFKKGFDGQVEELIGDFILPIKKYTYKLYKAIKKN